MTIAHSTMATNTDHQVVYMRSYFPIHMPVTISYMISMSDWDATVRTHAHAVIYIYIYIYIIYMLFHAYIDYFMWWRWISSEEIQVSLCWIPDTHIYTNIHTCMCIANWWYQVHTCVYSKVFICHGGLFRDDRVTLEDIQKVNRVVEPPLTGILCDILWSDPQETPGIRSCACACACACAHHGAQPRVCECGCKHMSCGCKHISCARTSWEKHMYVMLVVSIPHDCVCLLKIPPSLREYFS
jgi:diadenosine tetraphosphatase ApaH/serine/threonine PP2A family protein phosphatase